MAIYSFYHEALGTLITPLATGPVASRVTLRGTETVFADFLFCVTFRLLVERLFLRRVVFFCGVCVLVVDN